MPSFPDYYALLNVSENATAEEIKEAYRREALLYHPDRHAGDDSSNLSQEEATARFQQISDAYYTLIDSGRRAEYDNARKSRKRWNPAGTNASEVFGDAFDELLRPEVSSPWPVWQAVGFVAGGTVGFIIANIPGAVIGAYGGSKLGAIRDAKGVSVYAAFQNLSSAQRQTVLQALLTKMVTGGMSAASRR